MKLKNQTEIKLNLDPCPSCHTKAGNIHKKKCTVERCSVCASPRIGCDCTTHDRGFARWTGFWPGELESRALNMDLDTLYTTGFYKILFVKPIKK